MPIADYLVLQLEIGMELSQVIEAIALVFENQEILTYMLNIPSCQGRPKTFLQVPQGHHIVAVLFLNTVVDVSRGQVKTSQFDKNLRIFGNDHDSS